MIQDYQIERLDFSDPKDMQKLVDLQNAVYEGKHTFSKDIFQHWYLDNPNGHVVSFNAFFGEIIAAHYALVPIKMKIADQVVPGLLSMATVTHPCHRGKGLFRDLAKMSYDYAANNGFDFVVGVANANSFPGFIKYFPFQYVGQLECRVGWGNHIKSGKDKLFSGYWTEEAIKWRCGKKYTQTGDTIIGTHGKFSRTLVGCFDEKLIASASLPKANFSPKPSLYIGLGGKPQGIFIKMPKFIKHSPFNLIFMDLTGGKLPKITKDNVFFQLFDFDVA